MVSMIWIQLGYKSKKAGEHSVHPVSTAGAESGQRDALGQ